MKHVKNLKIRTGALALTGTILLTGLTGCANQEKAPVEDYDVVGSDIIDEDGTKGLNQELSVPGEDFKLSLVVSYDESSKREWRITSDKYLYLAVCTKGLSNDTEVYIDNIHIDTSIKSDYACMDGILQDTMDDHIHNSLMLGFPISDTTYYYGVDAIEGCNDTFIKGTFFGYSGYSSGDVEEKRYTESDYETLGVYANKFQIVFDLLIKNPNDKDYHNVSVSTDFIVYTTSKSKTLEKAK